MQTFDYVIAGAGSPGCVLANRVSQNGKFTVSLLEAGSKERYLAGKALVAAFAAPAVSFTDMQRGIRGDAAGTKGLLRGRRLPDEYENIDENGRTNAARQAPTAALRKSHRSPRLSPLADVVRASCLKE